MPKGQIHETTEELRSAMLKIQMRAEEDHEIERKVVDQDNQHEINGHVTYLSG